LKPLCWIAALGLLSGGPACAEVLWSPVGAENPESGDSFDEDWIDPFAINDSELPAGDGAVRWERIPERTTTEQAVVWEPVEPGDDNLTTTATSRVPKPPAPALESMNRSIAFSDGRVGPDIGFLVPPGFRWTPDYILDNSIRGWSRRAPGEEFLAWNNGDAVGQLYLQPFHGERWSLGANLGIRSLYQGSRVAGGATRVGEGVSAGFRLDYSLTDTFGVAIGAEQLVHFDNLTDTGRDIYLVASKGWWLGRTAGDFPLVTATAGIGTGYLGRNPYLQFGCSNSLGGAGISTTQYFPLCWGPIASGALVLSPKLSVFSEFNNFAFVTGASVAPFERLPLRATWGVTLAQDFGGGTEDFRFEPDKTRWFFRVSLGL
jgi:hypothetical protein